MKLKRNQLLIILLVTGFFIGSIYTSIEKLETEIFNIAVLENVRNFKIVYEQYLFYIAMERMGMLLLVIFVGQVYWKQIYAGLLTVIIGITFGSIISMAGYGMGFKGIVLCVIGMFPHMIFYGISYWILICHWMSGKVKRWRKSKVLGTLLFMSMGILSEVYVNPFLLKIFL